MNMNEITEKNAANLNVVDLNNNKKELLLKKRSSFLKKNIIEVLKK